MALVLVEAGENGYEYSEKELSIIRENQKRIRRLSFFSEYGGLEIRNPIELPQLYLSREEKDEVIKKTIGNVIAKL